MDSSTAHFMLEMSDPAPVSVNKLYATGQHGRRFLTKEGLHFKQALTSMTARTTMSLPWMEGAVDVVYAEGGFVQMGVVIAMPNLLNKSWKEGGSRTQKGTPRSRYKRVDATNYVKLIEDAVADGTGIDDSNHLVVTASKRYSATPYVAVSYYVYPYDKMEAVLEWAERRSSYPY